MFQTSIHGINTPLNGLNSKAFAAFAERIWSAVSSFVATSTELLQICDVRISQIRFLLQEFHPRFQEFGPSAELKSATVTVHLAAADLWPLRKRAYHPAPLQL
jgi:hypothetical protein